ncbi:MAG: hypothetical protein AAGB97_05935 [Dehalococcoidia bacterium]
MPSAISCLSYIHDRPSVKCVLGMIAKKIVESQESRGGGLQTLDSRL